MNGRSFNRIQAFVFTDRHHDGTLGRHAEEKSFRGADSLEGQNQSANCEQDRGSETHRQMMFALPAVSNQAFGRNSWEIARRCLLNNLS
jgi:hypothetical protein